MFPIQSVIFGRELQIGLIYALDFTGKWFLTVVHSLVTKHKGDTQTLSSSLLSGTHLPVNTIQGLGELLCYSRFSTKDLITNSSYCGQLLTLAGNMKRMQVYMKPTERKKNCISTCPLYGEFELIGTSAN